MRRSTCESRNFVRRVTAALDARSYQVIPIAAPTDEERAHHYLWRFWRHLSRAGRLTIFDRSWYGRVLVERVEGFATREEWMRAYSEINEFEEQLVGHGTVLVKCWVHITFDEQLRRFKEREKTRHKQWKLTAEDWRLNADRSRTDSGVFLRPAAWYQARLLRQFRPVGGGLLVRRGYEPLLWELERPWGHYPISGRRGRAPSRI